jgi:hypothetical protein
MVVHLCERSLERLAGWIFIFPASDSLIGGLAMPDFQLEAFKHYVVKREEAHTNKDAGNPWPWTDDEILQQYSFCNHRREDDRTTKYIKNNIRDPHADCPDVHVGLAVTRLVNHPDTLAELGYPVPWDADHFRRVLDARAACGETVFGAGYNIGNGGKEMPKPEYLAAHVLGPLWRYRAYWRPRPGEKLALMASRLQQFEGFAGFMTGQVIADVKYLPSMLDAPDWFSFVLPGPGSRRGLARIIGKSPEFEWARAYPGWLPTFREFEAAIRPWLVEQGLGDPRPRSTYEVRSSRTIRSCSCRSAATPDDGRFRGDGPMSISPRENAWSPKCARRLDWRCGQSSSPRFMIEQGTHTYRLMLFISTRCSSSARFSEGFLLSVSKPKA